MTKERQEELEKKLGFSVLRLLGGTNKQNADALKEIARQINVAYNRPNHPLFTERREAIDGYPGKRYSQACERYVGGLKREYLLSKGYIYKGNRYSKIDERAGSSIIRPLPKLPVGGPSSARSRTPRKIGVQLHLTSTLKEALRPPLPPQTPTEIWNNYCLKFGVVPPINKTRESSQSSPRRPTTSVRQKQPSISDAENTKRWNKLLGPVPSPRRTR